MSLDTKHPTYTMNRPDWVLMRDCYEGERRIKDMGTVYLPATSSMRAEGMSTGQDGLARYDAYKMRALYHDCVRPAVEAMLGVMHRKPAQIVVPDGMQDLLKTVLFTGESAQQALYKFNEQQLLVGRIGAMVDVPKDKGPDALPYICTYTAENIFNWDTTRPAGGQDLRLQFVSLNEAGQQRSNTTFNFPTPDLVRVNGLEWQSQQKYRVLVNGEFMSDTWPGLPPGYSIAATQNAQTWVGTADFKQPMLGGVTLDDIPFVFIGSRDLTPEPDIAPLLGLARISLAIYRTEADYREALFKQGQAMLTIAGAINQEVDGQKLLVGAGQTLYLPIGGTAQFVAAGHEGLDPMAQAIKDDEARADTLGAQLLNQSGNVKESGDALSIRSAARTASLTSVAIAGAEGLRRLLCTCAKFMGENADDIQVKPNLEFGDTTQLAADLVSLMTAKNLGAPISKQTVHWWMGQRNFTNLTWEDEQEELDSEPPPLGTPGAAGAPDATGLDPLGQPGQVPGDPASPEGKAQANLDASVAKAKMAGGVGTGAQPRKSGASRNPTAGRSGGARRLPGQARAGANKK